MNKLSIFYSKKTKLKPIFMIELEFILSPSASFRVNSVEGFILSK
ncbi:MAG: hypothetical protein Q8O30_09915 [Candidatus Omnitrophota bacterium]|nr:hypothetical protein [Candidatus Omnitrophota bacterium]